MKLKRFRVQMFKCILDSGWVDVTDLTVLVGKNEAGKTSLLKALQKFNPLTPEPYSMAREWPRGHRGERSDSQVVCQAEFRLDAADTDRPCESYNREHDGRESNGYPRLRRTY